MSSSIEYCLIFTTICIPMDDWNGYLTGFSVTFSFIAGILGFLKIMHELKTSSALKRTEFFINQHRRLFDDKDLNDVLCMIDEDKAELRKEEWWDKKRKFLTFFEEIELLIRSDQMNKDAAYYMFGYYAKKIQEGKNFKEGIDLARQHWSLFYDFADNAQDFLRKNPEGPKKKINL